MKIFLFIYLFIFSEYFHKRAPVIACHILSNDPQRAVMEFSDKKTVRKILEIPTISLQGSNLTLHKALHHLLSLLSLPGNKDETDESDDDDDQKQTSRAIPVQKQAPVLEFPSTHQSFIAFPPSPEYVYFISIERIFSILIL